MRKCVFLDRDGVLNQEIGDYVYRLEDLTIPPRTHEALQMLKEAGFLLIVVTNQAGIAKGLYSRSDVWQLHGHFQKQFGGLLDDLYFCPHHPNHTSNSLLRKPHSLMLEKAMAKYEIDPAQSWMIGDRPRDIQAGTQAGVHTAYLSPNIDNTPTADLVGDSLWALAEKIVRATAA